jgi:hypothetical protein
MTDGPRPLMIEIVAYAPTAFYHCTHCEVVWQETGFSRGVREEQAASALPPEMLKDYQAVSDWVRHLVRAYGDRVVLKVIDAVSLEGVWKTTRHGLRRYPAVIVAGRESFAGADFSAAEAAIARHLAPVGA